MIAVLGATGNTGSRIATTLLDLGQAVRVIARSADKLASLAARGADAVATDLTDAGAMSSSAARRRRRVHHAARRPDRHRLPCPPARDRRRGH